VKLEISSVRDSIADHSQSILDNRPASSKSKEGVSTDLNCAFSCAAFEGVFIAAFVRESDTDLADLIGVLGSRVAARPAVFARGPFSPSTGSIEVGGIKH